MNFPIYFDETLFQDGRSLKQYSNLSVYNKADAYIAKRHGFKVNMPLNNGIANQPNTRCFIESNNTVDPTLCLKLVHINPPNLCYGITVYTMDATNKRIRQQINFNPITVMVGDQQLTEKTTTTVCQRQNNNSDNNIVPISIDEPKNNNVYTVNAQMTPFESAIMLKYFAANTTEIKITEHLYSITQGYFEGNRKWFKQQQQQQQQVSNTDNNDEPSSSSSQIAQIVWQNKKGELRYKQQILNLPTLTNLSGPTINLI